MAEIIDLTVSPHLEIIEVSSDQGNTPPPSPGSRHRTPENRKQKRKKGKPSNDLARQGDSGICSSSQPSRVHSPQIGNNRSERVKESTPHPQSTSQPAVDEPTLFFFDGAAAPIAVDDTPPPGSAEPNGDGNGLLLPLHVAIHHGNDKRTPTEIIPPPKLSSDDEEYIEYLDYEDRKAPGLVRYFEVEDEGANQSRPSIFKCKNCGAEGDHKTYECPIQICLTCGARDEHSTRSCPISKTCYTCGMKGHINKSCPNRSASYMASSDLRGDCDRCGSAGHNTNECPTLWRIYQYVNDEERIVIIQSREKKKQFAIGEGGEGYIGREVWCYNCANTGHLGDDCGESSVTFSMENSAFSSRNVMSGPFYDPATEPIPIKHGPREPYLSGDWDAGAPVDVGKRGKNKDRAKLEKRFREQENEDEDWFDDIQNARRGEGQVARAPGPRGKTLKFGSLKDGGHERSSSPPSVLIGSAGSSLLARLSDPRARTSRGKGHLDRAREPSRQSENSIRIRGAATEQRNQGRSAPASEWTRGEERDRRGRGSRQGHGPRYRGGYGR